MLSDDELRKKAAATVRELRRMRAGGFGLNGSEVEKEAYAARLLELLPPADDTGGPPFDAWSFVRDVLVRGAAIEQDTRATGRGYEQHSYRLDDAARELADRLKPHLKPTEAK